MARRSLPWTDVRVRCTGKHPIADCPHLARSYRRDERQHLTEPADTHETEHEAPARAENASSSDIAEISKPERENEGTPVRATTKAWVATPSRDDSGLDDSADSGD